MIPLLFAPFFHLQNPDVSSSRRRHGWCGTEFVIGFCHCVLTVINSISPYSPCFEACLADYSLVPTCLSCSVASLIFARSFLLRQKWTYPVVNMLFYSRYYIPQKHLCKSIRFSFDVGLWIVGWQVKTTTGSQSMMNDFWMTTIYLKMDLSNLWFIDTIWPDVLILSSNKK